MSRKVLPKDQKQTLYDNISGKHFSKGREIIGMTDKVEAEIKDNPAIYQNKIAKLCNSNSIVVSRRIEILKENKKIVGVENLSCTKQVATTDEQGNVIVVKKRVILANPHKKEFYFHKSFFTENEPKEKTEERMMEAFLVIDNKEKAEREQKKKALLLNKQIGIR